MAYFSHSYLRSRKMYARLAMQYNNYKKKMENMALIEKMRTENASKTYLKVFHEQGDFRWESRLYLLNYGTKKRVTRGAQFFHAPFIVSALVCFVMFFASLTYPKSIRDVSVGFTLGAAAAIVLPVAVAVIFFKYKNIKKIQDSYIRSWKDVKKEESRKATRN